jgi:hypothetical protein
MTGILSLRFGYGEFALPGFGQATALIGGLRCGVSTRNVTKITGRILFRKILFRTPLVPKMRY